MARRRIANRLRAGRHPRRGASSDMHAGGRGTGEDPTARCLRNMDMVLLDPQRLYDATLCSPDEFDYILHLYEEWLKRNDQMGNFRDMGAGGRANRGAIYPRHALLMLIADKKANVPMEMLADLFGTDIDGVGLYLSITDHVLQEVLWDMREAWAAMSEFQPVDHYLHPLSRSMQEAGSVASDARTTSIDIEIPVVDFFDTIRERTAKNYPGLLPPKRTYGEAGPEDADAARRRVEEARVARVALDVGARLKQYRRITDPYTGFPGLDIEIAVISGLENFHLVWDRIARENGPLLRKLAQKRDSWV